MQRYTIFLINVNALHVSGGFSVHHHELKNCTHSIASKLDKYPMFCVQFMSSDDGRRNLLKHVEH